VEAMSPPVDEAKIFSLKDIETQEAENLKRWRVAAEEEMGKETKEERANRLLAEKMEDAGITPVPPEEAGDPEKEAIRTLAYEMKSADPDMVLE